MASRRTPGAARSWSAALQRAVPALAGLLVIVVLAVAALRIGDANLQVAEGSRLEYRRVVTFADGAQFAERQNTTTVAELVNLAGLTPDKPVVDQRLMDRLRIGLGTDTIVLTALVGRDTRALASLPAAREAPVGDLGRAWDEAWLGRPTFTDVFRYEGQVANATLIPVGKPQPWAVLVVVARSAGSPWQVLHEHQGSMSAEPGGFVAVDRQGVAVASWDPALLGTGVISPSEVAGLPTDTTLVWRTGTGVEEQTYIGYRLPSGYAFLFQQETAKLNGDLEAAQAQRNRILLAVLGVALAGLVAFQLARERAARRAEARLHALLKNGQDIVVLTDGHGQVTFVSPALEGLLGHGVDRWEHQDVAELCHPDDVERLRRLVSDPGAGPELNVRLRDEFGDDHWFDIEASDLRGVDRLDGVLFTCHEIGERKALQDELSFLATHDNLTGLPNRAEFSARLESLIAEGRPKRPFVLVYVDLDHFKPINDTLGHDAGDRVLSVVAERMRRAAGPNGFVCRFGGDEFGVLLDGADEETGRVVAERLLEGIRSPIAVGATLAHVDASIGIACAEPGEELGNPEQLVRRADQAMYRAKQSGRGRLTVAEPPAPNGRGHSAGPVHRPVGRGAAAAAKVAAGGTGDDPGSPTAQPMGPAPVPSSGVSGHKRNRMVAVAPILVAVAVMAGITGLGYAQSAAWLRDAEAQRRIEAVDVVVAGAEVNSQTYDPQRLGLLATDAPWTLNGGPVDQAILRVFQTSPTSGPEAAVFLLTTEGKVLASAPAGAAFHVPTDGKAWRDALEGRTGAVLRVHDDDQQRAYLFMPILREGRTVAVLAMGGSARHGSYAHLLELASQPTTHSGIWSLVDEEGVAYASADPALLDRRIVEPAALNGLRVGQGGLVPGNGGDNNVAAPQASYASSSPSFLVHSIPDERMYGDLRVGQRERDLSMALLLVAAVAGLVWVNHRREAAVRRSEDRLDALLQNAHDVVVVLDSEGRATFVSSAVYRLLGYEPGEHVGRKLLEIVHPDDRPRVAQVVSGARQRGAFSITDVRLREAHGGFRWFDIDGIDLRDHPEVAGTLLTCHEVDKRKSLQDQLAYQARHDPLTGLPNRATLAERLEELATDEASGEFAILFVDLDHFKPVNDTLGHDAGDEVLRTIASRLTRAVRGGADGRPGDLVCRLGGDEFAVVLLDATESVARSTAERVIAVTREPVVVADTVVNVGATIGIALSHPAQEDPNIAVRRADVAMYQAKEAGRGTYAMFDTPNPRGMSGGGPTSGNHSVAQPNGSETNR